MNADGKPNGLLSVGRDITDQRKAETARDEALESTRKALAEVEALKAQLSWPRSPTPAWPGDSGAGSKVRS